MDCLIKHHDLIGNPRYGLLGLVTMKYQFIVEFLGPIFWVIYIVLLMCNNMFSFLTLVFVGYFLSQIRLTIFATYIETEKNICNPLIWISSLIFITIGEIVLHIPSMTVKLFGILTFHWRKLWEKRRMTR